MSRPRLSFDDFAALHPGTPSPYGGFSIRLPCPACAADSYVLTDQGDGSFAAHCLADLGGKRRSQLLSVGCSSASVAAALGMTTAVYAAAFTGIAPWGSDGIDWASFGVLEDLDRARLVRRHVLATGRDIAFSHELNPGWLLWDGEIWAPTHSVGALVHEVADLLAGAADDLNTEARTETDEDRAKSLQARASITLAASRGCQRDKWIAATTNRLRDLPGVVVSLTDFDANPNLLQAANGTIDLSTGEIRAPRKEDRITRRLAVDYRPEATSPLWDTFLSEVFIAEDSKPDPEVVSYVRRLIGYGITGSTREQCFAVLHGGGGNGKGVFINLLSSIFRPITATTPFSTFEERAKGSIPNDIAALRDARLVMASEGEVGRPMAEAVIKSVTGSDPISARFMRAEFFTFTPQFLIMLATNSRPNFKGQDEGLWRRVKLLSFRQSFTYAKGNRDDTLEGRLREQSEGILAWAVRGAVEWAEHGLCEPASITAATRDYRRESDRLGDFLAERITVTGERLDVVPLRDLYATYVDWTTEEQDTPMRRATFAAAMSERPGVTRDIRSQAVVFRNVKIRTVQERKAVEQAAVRADRAVSIVAEESA